MLPGHSLAPLERRSDRPSRETLVHWYLETRQHTETLAAPLSAEDQTVQSMPDASPTKWHRAHTSWFFEAFLLGPRGIEPVDPRYGFLFNSYYEAMGPRLPRPDRGLVSRPSVAEIAAYRAEVDARVVHLLASLSDDALREVEPVVSLGLAHEEQHQELLLTDILHAFSRNPLLPAYRGRAPAHGTEVAKPIRFVPFAGGLVRIGASARQPFAFDNERPRHTRWLEPFAIGDRLVTVGEVRAFIAEGGYSSPSLWLSDGWSFVQANDVRAPLHARVEPGSYAVFGLDGLREANDAEPAVHVSFYEADAIARFLGARLPTEAEWEVAAANVRVSGNLLESGALRPRAAQGGEIEQLFGDAWEWTRSSYDPYPGYVASPGALGEYNAKFMAAQVVLRGGSCFTPTRHIHASYRNFWPPGTRFQVAGVRLAKDLTGGHSDAEMD